jgi:hypothetical protein
MLPMPLWGVMVRQCYGRVSNRYVPSASTDLGIGTPVSESRSAYFTVQTLNLCAHFRTFDLRMERFVRSLPNSDLNKPCQYRRGSIATQYGWVGTRI